MKSFPVFALVLLGTAATAAHAQKAIPDLKGTWTGKGKSIVFGTNPASSGFAVHGRSAARTRHRGEVHRRRSGGWLAWGRSASSAADTMEPFAWAMASDNKTIVGADMDGYFRITLVSRDRMEKCYTQNNATPSKAIVATCHMMDRVKP